MVQRKIQSEKLQKQVAPFLDEWAEHDINEPWQQFRNWATQQILWDYNPSTEEILSATEVDGQSDKGIDGWWYDEDDKPPRLVLIQSKNTDIARSDFSKLIEGFKDLVVPDRPLSVNTVERK